MPELEIDQDDRHKADDIVKFVRSFTADLSQNGRFYLALELLRLFKPEYDELKRKGSQN